MENSLLNATFACGLPPFFPPALDIPEAVNIIQATVAVAAALVGAPINIYLFIIIIKYRVLHQRSLFLSIQIIAIEILYHCTIPVTILVSTVEGTWVFGKVLCNITGMIHDGFAMFRFTMTLVLTIDRFISVYKPSFYIKHGGKVSWTLSATMWIITIIRAVLPLTGILDCFIYIPAFKTCTLFPGCSDKCEHFASWSVAMVVLSGVVLPLLIYALIFYFIRKITKYYKSIQTATDEDESKRNEKVRTYTNMINNWNKFVTVSLLLISIVGTTPAFTLYMASLFHPNPNKSILIVNMLIGRTSFNLIPFFDALALSRHQDIKKISLTLFRSMKSCIVSKLGTKRSQSVDKEHSKYSSEPNKSLTSVTSI